MITLQNMIFANPQAYQVFPNMVNPYNTGTTELARYTGYLIITDNNGNTHSFTNTSTIDFTTISGLVTIDNVTDRGSVQLGRWRIPQSIIITNDITVTVTPIDEVSSDGATIIPQYEVKYNTYSNGELSESIVVTPDNITLQTNVQWITVDNDQIVVSANTNTEARQGQVIIRVQFQEYSAMANYNIVQASHDIGQDIMQSMVLWYDLKKQGATNESMATTPTLIDHSGNGHDATCYNFAWSGMSGVGGYATNFSKRDSTLIDSDIYTLTDNKLIINQLSSTVEWLLIKNSNNKGIPKSTCKVTGLENSGINLIYYYMDEINVRSGVNLTEGLNELPESILFPDATSGTQIGLYASNIPTNTNIDLTIELLPLYPHALVSDGVDDYCLVEGLPLLNKEDGYTVIAKRKWLDEDNEGTTAFASKTTNTYGNDGAFMFEYKDTNGTNKATKSFTHGTGLEEFEKNDITYQSSGSYNGYNVSVGSAADVTVIILFRFCINNDGYYGKFALYSLLLFNRDLTPEEIEWVKTNLIETEQ